MMDSLTALTKVKTVKDGSSLDDLKSAIDELNTAWNVVASKMYAAANKEGDTPVDDEARSDSTKKGKSKKKDDAEIDDVDYEVVE